MFLFFVWELKVRFNLFGIKTAIIVFSVSFLKCHQNGKSVHHIDVFVIIPQRFSQIWLNPENSNLVTQNKPSFSAG